MHSPHSIDRRAAQAFATGRTALQQGRTEDAIVAFRDALKFAPNYAPLHHALGDACTRAKRLTEAEPALRRARDLVPSEFRYQLALADVLYLGGAREAALREYLRATEIDPSSAAAWSNVGAIFHQLGEPEQALGALHRALAIDPRHAMALSNSGLAFFDVGEYELARACLSMAVEVKPDYEAARWNRAILDLLHGDYVRGWEGHEHRQVQLARMGKLRTFPEPRWDGSSFVGKRLLVWPEQGLGDQLQFVRFIPRVKALGGTLILACASPLRRMFQELKTGADEIVVIDEPYDAVDLQIPLMSIPHVLRLGNLLDEKRIPYVEPVGSAPDALAELLAELLAESSLLSDAARKLRVGLVWAGQPRHQNDKNRSIDLRTLGPLFDVPSVQWFSLQKGSAAEAQLEQLNAERMAEGRELITPLGPYFTDFADTSHAVSAMDLVITVDTAVAHLAGAMEVPVWIMLPFAPDWRWQLKREDTPWYPSARLFRQSGRGDWSSVVARIGDALGESVGNMRREGSTKASEMVI